MHGSMHICLSFRGWVHTLAIANINTSLDGHFCGMLYSQTENGERQYTPDSVGEDTVASPVISRSSNCFIHWRLYSSLVIPPFLTTLLNQRNILKRRLQGFVVFVSTRPNSERYREWVGPNDYYMLIRLSTAHVTAKSLWSRKIRLGLSILCWTPTWVDLNCSKRRANHEAISK